MRKLTAMGCGVALSLGLGAACSSDAEKICDHLVEIERDDDDSRGDEREKRFRERCVKEFEQELGKCKNKAAVVDCFTSLKKGDDDDRCEDLCDRDR
jgi:hypothetical protein